MARIGFDKDIRFTIDKIDFCDIYNETVNKVFNEYNIVFTPAIQSKLLNIGEDLSMYKNAQLTDFFSYSPTNFLIIGGKNCSVNKDLFKIINISTYEHLINISNREAEPLRNMVDEMNLGLTAKMDITADFKLVFFNRLKAELKKHLNIKRDSKTNMFYYDSVQDYIIASINSAILNTIILKFKDSSVYKDYDAINKQNKTI